MGSNLPAVPDPRRQTVPAGWAEANVLPALNDVEWGDLDDYEGKILAMASYIESMKGDVTELEKALRMVEKRRGDLLDPDRKAGRPIKTSTRGGFPADLDIAEPAAARYRKIARYWNDVVWPHLAPAKERKDVTQSAVLRVVDKQITRDDRAAAAAKSQVPDGVRLDHCTYEDQAAEIPDESVALVFTDPPYARKNLPHYERIAEIASRILVPGGSLLCYCGHFLVPDLYPAMSKHLRPWWIAAVTHGGHKARMTEYGIIVNWKPLLWFVKGTRGDKHRFVDDITVGQREKEGHPWQQAESEARYWIEGLTGPGETVWDPFCGSGTTAAAAHRLGRIVWTCDVDPDAIAAARVRLSVKVA